jgi:hypothetical protein
MDFTFGFDEIMNTELDTSTSENQLTKEKCFIPKPANQKEPIPANKKSK